MTQKPVEDFGPDDDGATVTVDTTMRWTGTFVKVEREDKQWCILFLTLAGGARAMIYLRTGKLVDYKPLPKIVVGSDVINDGYWREGQPRWFRRRITGTVLAVKRDTLSRVVYEVKWSDGRQAFYLRTSLVLLTDDLRVLLAREWEGVEA